MNRRAAHAAFLALMTHFEVRLRRNVIIDKNRFIRACAARFELIATPNFFDLAGKHTMAIQGTLTAAYKKIVPAFGRHAMGQVDAAAGRKSRLRYERKGDDEEFWLDLAQEWVNREGLKRAHLIADTTQSDVLAAVNNGLDQGLGVREIARNIRRVTGLSGSRADLIARTEVHAAANYGSIETVRNAEKELDMKMLKEWGPTLDSRTRESHAAMAGSPAIPLDQPFLVGGQAMDRPGDPAGGAENVVNCRCVCLFSEAP